MELTQANRESRMLEKWPDYELIDFGNGRKLERFGDRRLIRPCPAAKNIRPRRGDWKSDAEFVITNPRSENSRGEWILHDSATAAWSIKIAELELELYLTAFGHIGVFPEHFRHWQWALQRKESLRDCKLLNLFAYTGAFTLLLAAAGAHVTHLDSSAAAIHWARRNAKRNGLERAPIRWLCEDALRFVKREIKRGSRYDGFVADPPTFGRGPKNETWQIKRDLGSLLQSMNVLLSDRPQMLLLSCHSAGLDAKRLRTLLQANCPKLPSGKLEADTLYQVGSGRRQIAAGTFVRWRSRM